MSRDTSPQSIADMKSEQLPIPDHKLHGWTHFLGLYTYLHKIAGDSMTNLYNWANVLIFTVISAAMITVSCSAVRLLFDIPAQLQWYPTNGLFVLIVLAIGMIVVLVAMYGFNAVAEFSSICGPWLVVMFTSGALVLFPTPVNSIFPTPTRCTMWRIRCSRSWCSDI